jgi:hypothetical protein
MDANKQIVDNIINAHVIGERITVKSKCLGCNGDFSLVWNKDHPNFIHSDGLTECPSAKLSESAAHRLAKKYLVYYLNRGLQIIYESQCRRCGRSNISVPIEGALTFEEEVRHNGPLGEKCFFDVAGLSESQTIVYGIEVFYGHKTDGTMARKNVPWFEVKALDVLSALKECKEDSAAVLTECRYTHVCSNRDCISLEEIAVKLGFLNRVDPYGCEARRVLDEAIKGKYMAVQGWNTTGYIEGKHSITKRPTQKIVDIFLSRKCCLRCGKAEVVSTEKRIYTDVENITTLTSQNNTPVSCNDNMIKLSLVNNPTLPHSEVESNSERKIIRTSVTVIKNPYCVDCYKVASRLGPPQIDWMDSDRKDELRSMLNWMRGIPGNWQPGMACFYCHKTYEEYEDNKNNPQFWEPGKRTVACSTWYFGANLRLCTVCLDRHLRDREIIL